MKLPKFYRNRRSFLNQIFRLSAASLCLRAGGVFAGDMRPGAPTGLTVEVVDIDERRYKLWLQQVQMAAEKLAEDSGASSDQIDIKEIEKSTKETFEKNGYKIVPPKPPVLLDVQ